MNRKFLAAALSVAALIGLARPALALWPFHCCSPCKKCGADFCIRQYNAFSPVCHGTIYCDGIHPFAGPGYPGAVSPWIDAHAGGGCPTCAGGPMMGGHPMGAPMMGAPGMAAPGYGAPMLPAPMMAAPGMAMPGYGAPPPMGGRAPMFQPPAAQPGFPPQPGVVPPPPGYPGFPPQPGVAPPPAGYPGFAPPPGMVAPPPGYPGFPPRPMQYSTPITSADASGAWMIPAAPVMPVGYPGYGYPGYPAYPEYAPMMMPWAAQ